MSNNEIINAWRDEDYSDSLSEMQRSLLPENPAGAIELSDADMEIVAGGGINISNFGGNCPVSNAAGGCVFSSVFNAC